MPLDEKELINMIFQRWEKEWKDQKNEQVAVLYNEIVEIVTKQKAHIDEIIIALELALQEALDAKVRMIREQRGLPPQLSETLPSETKG